MNPGAVHVRRLIALLGVVAVVCLGARPVAAHGDEGKIDVVGITSPSPLTLQIEALITFVGDGHAAPAATATVVAERPGATSVGPVVLGVTPTAGRYAAAITLPSAGEWTLRISSLSPIAVTERRETVTAPAPTTVAPTTAPASTTTVAAAATTSVASGGVAPLTSTAAGSPAGSGGDDTDADGGGRIATTLVFIGVLVAVVLVAGLALRSARRAKRSGGTT